MAIFSWKKVKKQPSKVRKLFFNYQEIFDEDAWITENRAYLKAVQHGLMANLNKFTVVASSCAAYYYRCQQLKRSSAIIAGAGATAATAALTIGVIKGGRS